MQLRAYLLDRYLLHRRLKPASSNALIWSVGNFSEWFAEQPDTKGKQPTIADLAEDLLSRFVRDRENQGYAPGYIKRIRADVITVWRDAAQEFDQIAEPRTHRIRAVKVPQKPPVAWTFAQVRSLLKACDQASGWYETSGIKRSAYWRAFVLLAWDTGIRVSDVNSIRWDQYRDGAIAITQVKTSRVHFARLSEPTIAALEAIREPKRELILPWDHTPQTKITHFRKLTDAAGLVGTPKKLRKSAASEVERQQPGAAQQFLGHATPGLAYKNYVDPTVAMPERPVPRALEEDS